MKHTLILGAVALVFSAACIGQHISGLDPEPPKAEPSGVQAAIELNTGERIDGQFARSSVDGVLFQTAGQTITISLDRIRAICFGKSAAQPSPADDPPGITTDNERAFL